MTNAQQTETTAIIARMAITGHTAEVAEPAAHDEMQNGVYVIGSKRAALGRLAFVSDEGATTWIH